MCAKAIDDKKLIVIKFNTGAYWCGLGKTDMQLRNALIYTDEKMAKKAAEGCIKKSTPFRHPLITSYKLVEVKMYEVEEIE